MRPVSDLDIYRCADLLVKQHGDEAPIEAAMTADAMLDRGDLNGQRVWLRILKAINELLADEPVSGAKLH